MAKGLKLPHFIIAGAPRSGTGWLCALLAKHPQIGLAQPLAPEPKFFLVDELYERGIAYYAERWFVGIDREVRGEKSTNYLEDPRCATRIAQALPEVKLIFALRNPVDRAYSNYAWSRRNGFEREDFATALALDGKREVEPHLRYARPFDYLSRGHYAELLRPYFEAFARERILLLSYEETCMAPATIAERLHRFLEVAVRPADTENLEPVNQSGAGGMDDASRRILIDYYAARNRDLQDLTGFDIARWTA